MSHSIDNLHASSTSTLGHDSPLPEARASTKRPRERSTSPGFDDASTRLYGTELESEEGLLSFSDLIRPLSATPSPEPSLHFGTPPRMFRINNPGAITSSDYESSIIQYVTRSSSHEEEGDEVVDDSAVAEMRKTVVAWGLASKNDSGAEPEQSSSSRNRQLAMMVMALTHPARPTASQVAAQAEHIRALLAERSVIMQQLEDMSEFRNADRLGFERTAQALNARVVKSTRLNGSPLTTRETVYQDERTRNAELHAYNERLNSENIRLERGFKDAKREISALKQSIESLRVNLLVRPHTPPSAGSQATFHSVANPPTPNPRGRPRKYPILSPTHASVFQAPTHSNPGAQLPVSSSSILNTSASLPANTQPPPEKRLRATQPDARAELLLAAARRVGKDRVVEVLEGPEIKRLGGASAKADLELELERDENLPQPRAAPAQHESPPATRIDHSNTRRGRPSRTSVSFPSGAHHHFNQFLVEDNGKPDLGRGRGAKMRATKSAQEMSKHAVETAKGGGVFDVRGNAQSHAPRQPQIQTQQVVVAFTGNPQADAQACLASFLAQYPGIQPVPMWGAGKGDDASAMAGESEMTVMDQLATSNGTHGGMVAGAGTIHRMHSTPELTRSGSRGLEHLLTAARTVLRARSRSTTPTPRRQLHSASLSSPYRLAQQNHSPPSPKSRQVASARRRHSSPVVQPGDSDTEPEETPKSRQRVYSALDVLADQAAAVRTSSPDPPMDVFTSSQNLFERTTEPAASVPVSPTLLSPPQPVTVASLSEPSTSLDVMSSEKPLLDSLSSSSLKRPRVPSEGPFGGGQLAVPGTTTGAEAESLDQAGQSIRQHTEGRKGDPVHHQETDSWQIPSVQPGTDTPQRSDKARGKQRA